MNVIATELLRYFPEALFGRVHETVPIMTGLSGASVYSATTDTGEFILRIGIADCNAFARSLAAERTAARHGLAPAIVHIDEGTSAIVSVKIASIPFGSALAQPSLRPVVITKLVNCLAQLHSISAPYLPATDIAALGQSIWDRQAIRDGFPKWATPLRNVIAAGGDVFARDERRVFSHNDVTPANLLWDGLQVWMVDWERAALTHPYLDLATFSNFINLSDVEALDRLALQERATITEDDGKNFLVLRSFSYAVYGAVFLGLVSDLAQIEFESRDATPTLSECYRRMGKGELDHKTSVGQAQLGAALLRHASS